MKCPQRNPTRLIQIHQTFEAVHLWVTLMHLWNPPCGCRCCDCISRKTFSFPGTAGGKSSGLISLGLFCCWLLFFPPFKRELCCHFHYEQFHLRVECARGMRSRKDATKPGSWAWWRTTAPVSIPSKPPRELYFSPTFPYVLNSGPKG